MNMENSTSNVTVIDVDVSPIQIHIKTILLLGIMISIGLPLNLIALLRTIAKYTADRCKITGFLHLRLHLNIADLLHITFFGIKSLIWQLTYLWYGGDFLCRLLAVIELFVHCLTANLVVCIAIDRTILAHKLTTRSTGNGNRTRFLTIIAYTLALISSIPQALVWGTFHPHGYPGYDTIDQVQCTTIWHQIHHNISSTGILQNTNSTLNNSRVENHTDPANTEMVYRNLTDHESWIMSFSHPWLILHTIEQWIVPVLLIFVCYLCIWCRLKHEISHLSTTNEEGIKHEAVMMSMIHTRNEASTSTSVEMEQMTLVTSPDNSTLDNIPTINEEEQTHFTRLTTNSSVDNKLQKSLINIPKRAQSVGGRVIYSGVRPNKSEDALIEEEISLPRITAVTNRRKWTFAGIQTAINAIHKELQSQYHKESFASESKDGRAAKISKHTMNGYVGATLCKAKNKTTRKAMYIICAYIVCWTPYFLFATLDIICPDLAMKSVFINNLRPYFDKLLILNSVLNPLIYGLRV